ncbi:peptidoglycan-recognition protein LB [Trichonephila clavata]|uniref:Peptidoglycan-recognition protein LB n=1 Tax=Trichonephila clavata TaxID=2740835 RepID=A0A8X6G076_TRICU|nr:peptidoglycan-recognition protein LB [Trichonephila clavata]
MGAHTKYHNRKSIGIAFLGDYDKDCPNPSMLDIIPKLVYCGVEKGYISPSFKVIAHKDAYCTSCPGTALYDVIKKWPHYPKVPIPTYTCDAKTEALNPRLHSTTYYHRNAYHHTTTTTTTTTMAQLQHQSNNDSRSHPQQQKLRQRQCSPGFTSVSIKT